MFVLSVDGEREREQEVVEKVAWERRRQQLSKHCPLPTARSPLPENHIAAAAVTPATTGMSSSSLKVSQNTLGVA